MKHLLISLFLLITVSSFAQTFKVGLTPFTELKITRGIQATLVQSDAKELSFEVKGVSKSDVIIEQDYDRLYIKIKTKALWESMDQFNWWVKVTVPYQNLTSIDVSTGAIITSDDIVILDNLSIENKMGGEVDLEVKITKLSIGTSMGSTNKLRGQAKNVTIDASMGAKVLAFGLESKYNTVESSMGSLVAVSCDFEFDGSATLGGGIEVRGNPEKAFKSESTGGWITVY